MVLRINDLQLKLTSFRQVGNPAVWSAGADWCLGSVPFVMIQHLTFEVYACWVNNFYLSQSVSLMLGLLCQVPGTSSFKTPGSGVAGWVSLCFHWFRSDLCLASLQRGQWRPPCLWSWTPSAPWMTNSRHSLGRKTERVQFKMLDIPAWNHVYVHYVMHVNVIDRYIWAEKMKFFVFQTCSGPSFAQKAWIWCGNCSSFNGRCRSSD